MHLQQSEKNEMKCHVYNAAADYSSWNHKGQIRCNEKFESLNRERETDIHPWAQVAAG